MLFVHRNFLDRNFLDKDTFGHRSFWTQELFCKRKILHIHRNWGRGKNSFYREETLVFGENAFVLVQSAGAKIVWPRS